MNSLYPSILQLIDRAIQRPVSGFSVSLLHESESVWPRLGRYFNLAKENGTNPFISWYGIYDTAIGPIVYIGIRDQPDWSKAIYTSTLKRQLPEGNHFRKPYRDLLRGELCFALKEDKTGWLFQTRQRDLQEKMLFDFYTEVLRFFEGYQKESFYDKGL